MTRLYNNHHVRINIISMCFFMISVVVLTKLLFIQSVKASLHKKNTLKAGIVKRYEKGSRGLIIDRNGEILAQTIQKYTFCFNTNNFFDKEQIV